MTVQRVVAAVAVVFGVATLVEGGRVLAGADPGFVVFRPLLLFNATMGVVYILAGLLTWSDHRRGRTWARAIALVNLCVLGAIAIVYALGYGVATRSLAAMSFRTLVWVGLFLALSWVGRRAAASDERRATAATVDEGWVIRPVDDAPETVTSFYAVDHDDIDGLLDEFRAARNGDRPAAIALFREFKGRLERHIGWEDDILFPLFERLSGMQDNGPTVVMRREHRIIRALLDSIDATLQQDHASIDADESDLLEVLAAHNMKEENILYPLIDRQISAADREALFTRMRAEIAAT